MSYCLLRLGFCRPDPLAFRFWPDLVSAIQALCFGTSRGQQDLDVHLIKGIRLDLQNSAGGGYLTLFPDGIIFSGSTRSEGLPVPRRSVTGCCEAIELHFTGGAERAGAFCTRGRRCSNTLRCKMPVDPLWWRRVGPAGSGDAGRLPTQCSLPGCAELKDGFAAGSAQPHGRRPYVGHGRVAGTPDC